MADNSWVGALSKGTAASRSTSPDFPKGTFGFYLSTDTREMAYGENGASSWSTLGSLSAQTPSTGTTIAGNGIFVTSSTGAQSFTVEAPTVASKKTFVANSTSTSTASRTFTLASGNIQSTASSTYTSVTLNGSGQFAVIEGISTSRYQVTGLAAAAVLA